MVLSKTAVSFYHIIFIPNVYTPVFRCTFKHVLPDQCAHCWIFFPLKDVYLLLNICKFFNMGVSKIFYTKVPMTCVLLGAETVFGTFFYHNMTSTMYSKNRENLIYQI